MLPIAHLTYVYALGGIKKTLFFLNTFVRIRVDRSPTRQRLFCYRHHKKKRNFIDVKKLGLTSNADPSVVKQTGEKEIKK